MLLGLSTLSDFARAWALLLEFLAESASDTSSEVAFAAVVALKDMLQVKDAHVGAKYDATPGLEVPSSRELWTNAWHVWSTVVEQCIQYRPVRSKAYLTVLLDCFLPLYQHLGFFISPGDVARVLESVRAIIKLQSHDTLVSAKMTDVQAMAIKVIMSFTQDIGGSSCGNNNNSSSSDGGGCSINNSGNNINSTITNASSTSASSISGTSASSSISSTILPRHAPLSSHISMVLEELITIASYGCAPPITTEPSSKRTKEAGCVPMAMVAMDEIGRLFSRYGDLLFLTRPLEQTIDMLKVPLALKYNCPSVLLWRRAVITFITIADSSLHSGMTLLGKASQGNDQEMFTGLIGTFVSLIEKNLAVLDGTLFTPCPYPRGLSVEERAADAALDVELVHLINNMLTALAPGVPVLASNSAGLISGLKSAFTPTMLKSTRMDVSQKYTERLVGLLKRGALGTWYGGRSDAKESYSPEQGLSRPDFVRVCFQSLVDYSQHGGGSVAFSANDEMFLDALLKQYQQVLLQYLKNDALGELEPSLHAEAVAILRAVTGFISLPGSRVTASPTLLATLIECVSCSHAEVRLHLKDTLTQYIRVFGCKGL